MMEGHEKEILRSELLNKIFEGFFCRKNFKKISQKKLFPRFLRENSKDLNDLIPALK